MPVINKFYLLCVIFSGSPDLTLKTCLVLWEKHMLRVFEDRVLREIFGAKRDEVRG